MGDQKKPDKNVWRPRDLKAKNMEPRKRYCVRPGIWARRNRNRIVYGISYMVGGKQRHEVTGDTVALAEKRLAQVRTEVNEGRYNFVQNRKAPTVNDAAARYIKAKQRKVSIARDITILERFKKRYGGTKRLDQLTRADIEDYRDDRAEDESGRPDGGNISGAAVNRELATIKCMLSLAVKREEIPRNVASGIDMFPEPELPIRSLTDAEADALVDACGGELRPVVAVALNTGMRRGRGDLRPTVGTREPTGGVSDGKAFKEQEGPDDSPEP